jgi:anti-anti-sigma regulatory factor
MSCKIERIVSPGAMVVLRISGRFDGEHVDTLRQLIAQERTGVAIDLTDVLLVDREAVRLLAATEANGIELKNCPAYIREWTARERDSSR